MTSSKFNREAPKFLSILGAEGFNFDEKNESISMNFNIGEDLTHSAGKIVQGGFITAMLDTSMAHLLIFKTNGEYNPLTLSLNVTFLTSGTSGKFVALANIEKMGKSISFTSAQLHQDGILVATATATNKLVKF